MYTSPWYYLILLICILYQRFGKQLVEDDNIFLIKDGLQVMNHLDLSDVIFKVFQRYFDGNYISEATKRWNQSCEEHLPTDDDTAQEPLPTNDNPAQRNMNVSFIDVDNNGNNTGKFLATERATQNVTGVGYSRVTLIWGITRLQKICTEPYLFSYFPAAAAAQ